MNKVEFFIPTMACLGCTPKELSKTEAYTGVSY